MFEPQGWAEQAIGWWLFFGMSAGAAAMMARALPDDIKDWLDRVTVKVLRP